MSISKYPIAGFCAVAFALSSASHAGYVDLGGVMVPTDLSEIDSGAFYQKFDVNSGMLSGYGEITSFNNDSGTDACPGCTLSYSFSAFDLDVTQSAANGSTLAFQNGLIDLWVTTPGSFDINDPSSAVGAGTPWLSLAGHSFQYVFADPVTFGALSLQFGTGMLDVTGGTYADNFNTNTLTDHLSPAGFADLSFTSSVTNSKVTGSPVDTGGSFVPTSDIFLPLVTAMGAAGQGDVLANMKAIGLVSLEGTGSMDVNASIDVPEPGSLALLGIGLGMLGFGARRKSRG